MKNKPEEFIEKAIMKFTGFKPGRIKQIVIEPTNICNCDCPICGSASSRNDQEKGFMDSRVFLSITSELDKIRPQQVCLYARGESLMHPEINNMIEILSGRGHFTELVTNGELLNYNRSIELLNSGLSKLVISYPGITGDNYYRCRGKKQPDDLSDRIKESVMAWKNSGRTVSLRCLSIDSSNTNPGNNDISKKFIEEWLIVEGLTMIEMHGYMPWPRHFDTSLISHLTANRKRCDLALNSLTIYWDGSVTPCSYDVFGELSAGTIQESSLVRIYNNRDMRFFRRMMFRKRFNSSSVCRQCLIPYYSVPLKVYHSEHWRNRVQAFI